MPHTHLETHRMPHAGSGGDSRFSFTLDVTHPRFGRLIFQRAQFGEVEP
jgi:hypothetical protein